MVHSVKERRNLVQETAEKDRIDYMLQKWLFVVLFCKVDNRLLCSYLRSHAVHTDQTVSTLH